MALRRPRWARVTHLLAAGALALLCAAPSALALEPPRPGELERYRQDGTLTARMTRARALGNYEIDPGLITGVRARAVQERIGGAGALLPPSAWTGMPTTGNDKVLAVLIDFDQYPALNTTASIQSQLFGNGTAGDYPYESLTNYYKRSSYDQLIISGNVLGPYHAGSRAAVSRTDAGRDALIKRALQSYDATHDFSQYDNDGDGVIDYFVVIWTGPDNGWANFWWGYQTDYGDPSVELDGKTLGTYSWQWESQYDGGTTDGDYDQVTTMHETGHALGLPDLYDYAPTEGPDGGVGGIDMMDDAYGDHNAFSKWVLGWLTPQVVTGAPQSVTLAASGTSPQALVVMPGASAGDPFSEYFVVQNRQRVGNDSDSYNLPFQDMPGNGLLIWHVDARLTATSWGDDYRFDNSYTSHKLLRLMEADGRNSIQNTSAYADAADYYKNGTTFTTRSTPDSRRYGGSPSGVKVTGIGAPGASMTFRAEVASDVVGPVCTAQDVIVRRGGTCRLYFKVHDALSAKVSTLLRVTTGSGVVKKRWSWGYGENYAGWWWVKYTPRLARGRYRIVVTGRDLEGNPQSVIGRARLTVR